MFEVKKCGKNEYGYWAVGTLKYAGLEIYDLYSVNKEVEANKSYKPTEVTLKRDKKNNLRFKIVL